MKLIINLTSVFLLLTTFTNAQETCGKYYPLTIGVKTEVTSYDKDGEVENVVVNEVLSYKEKGKKGVAQMQSITTEANAPGAPVKIDFTVTCNESEVEIDMKKLMKEKLSAGADKSTKISVDGVNIIFPNELNKGDELPDSKIDMNIAASGMKMSFYIYSLNRVVSGKETITTPAGTYDCFLITSVTETKMLETDKGTSKTWVAEGVGLVQSESYDDKGELISKQVLTKFTK